MACANPHFGTRTNGANGLLQASFAPSGLAPVAPLPRAGALRCIIAPLRRFATSSISKLSLSADLQKKENPDLGRELASRFANARQDASDTGGDKHDGSRLWYSGRRWRRGWRWRRRRWWWRILARLGWSRNATVANWNSGPSAYRQRNKAS